MEINNYLETNLSFASNLEVNDNWSRFDYNNQPFQCGKNAEGFWLMASCKEKDTPACFECDSEFYDDENEQRLEEMFQEKEQLNHFLKYPTKSVQFIEQDSYFKLSIELTENEFFSNSVESFCQQVVETSLLEEVKTFRRKFESLH